MNDFYELANRYLAMFEGASVKFHEDVSSTKVNTSNFPSRRSSCDLYLGVDIDIEQANTATTVICRVPGLDWPHCSMSGDNFIYSKDSVIAETLGRTTTLPPEHLIDDIDNDGLGGADNDDETWPEKPEDPEAPEEDAPFDDNSPTVW